MTNPATAPTAIIAEDEPLMCAMLKSRLTAAWPELTIVAEAGNGADALEAFAAHRPDIAFLDIRMPVKNGLDVARELGAACHVVFVTAYDEYAVDAFERGAVDYLLKPVTDERLAKCVERLQRKIASDVAPPPLADLMERLARLVPGSGTKLRWVRALKGEVVHQIAVDDVLYFNAADKYTRVVTREGEALIRTALADLSGELDSQRFVQIHRSTIVNMEEVASSRRDLGGRVFVKLKDGRTELPVSRAYAHLFKQM